jgi:hypothetical protein
MQSSDAILHNGIYKLCCKIILNAKNCKFGGCTNIHVIVVR